jgi:phospholipase/lecithinase/hemolysin
MRRVRTTALLAAWLAGCSSGDSGDTTAPPAPPGSPASDAAAPSALFVLGDSLSDVGNAAGAADYVLNQTIDPPTVGLCNPEDIFVVPRRCDDLFFEKSRVSDGPVAVEHLAARFGLAKLEPSLHIVPNRPQKGSVYAVASAKARGPGSEDLAGQVDWLLLDRAPLAADALYVVMIGGNDAIDAFQADVAAGNAVPRPSAAIITAAVSAIGASLERLLDLGARRIVVANVPDLAELPGISAAASASGDAAAALAAASAISASFNRELAAMLDGLATRRQWLVPTPIIRRFDLQAALSAARTSAAAAGGNSTDACFDSDTYREAGAARVFDADCAPATPDGVPRFAGFAFWDAIHPTGAANATIGAALSALF